MNNIETQKIVIDWQGHDYVEATISLLDHKIQSLIVRGCAQTHYRFRDWANVNKLIPLKEWPLPQGQHHSDMLLRELIQKAAGTWSYPYTEDELCHCRAVPTKKVDESILSGAETVQQVLNKTGAGSACGTCQIHTETLIKYRQGSW